MGGGEREGLGWVGRNGSQRLPVIFTVAPVAGGTGQSGIEPDNELGMYMYA